MALAAALAGCASQPQLVMLNRVTRTVVACPSPDPAAESGAYLVSRACLSACQAHGFIPVPGAQLTGSDADIPHPCLN